MKSARYGVISPQHKSRRMERGIILCAALAPVIIVKPDVLSALSLMLNGAYRHYHALPRGQHRIASSIFVIRHFRHRR